MTNAAIVEEKTTEIIADNLAAKKMKSSECTETVNTVPVLQVKKLSDKARLPERGSSLAAGYDLFR